MPLETIRQARKNRDAKPTHEIRGTTNFSPKARELADSRAKFMVAPGDFPPRSRPQQLNVIFRPLLGWLFGTIYRKPWWSKSIKKLGVFCKIFQHLDQHRSTLFPTQRSGCKISWNNEIPVSNISIYSQRKFRNLTSDYTESCCWRSVNQEMWSRRCDTAEMWDMRIWRVGSARNAVFFHSFVASPTRKVRS